MTASATVHCRVHALVVPVHELACGACTVWTARLADGTPTGVAFSSVQRLLDALGPQQRYELLSPGVAHAMLAEVGIGELRVDPELVVSGPRTCSSAPARQSLTA